MAEENNIQKAMTNPISSNVLIANTVKGYEDLRSAARSAMQVSQAVDESSIKMQMIIIAQNQRMIDLLEQLLKKKSP